MKYENLLSNSIFFLKQAAPFLISLGFLFLGLFPFRFSFMMDLYIPFIYVSLFCWLILRPDLLPPLCIFILGVLSDLMYANPLGFHTFIFMFFYLVVFTQRRFLIGHSFLFLWVAFAVLMGPMFCLQWGLASLISMQWMSFKLIMGQYLLSIGFYPLVAWLCSKTYSFYTDEFL